MKRASIIPPYYNMLLIILSVPDIDPHFRSFQSPLNTFFLNVKVFINSSITFSHPLSYPWTTVLLPFILRHLSIFQNTQFFSRQYSFPIFFSFINFLFVSSAIPSFSSFFSYFFLSLYIWLYSVRKFSTELPCTINLCHSFLPAFVHHILNFSSSLLLTWELSSEWASRVLLTFV